MRFILSLFLVAGLFAGRPLAGESAGDWLDRAANPGLSLREREYAARQVIMLADASASIIISTLRGDGSDSGLRRQVAAGLLGEIGSPAFEAPLLEAAFGEDYFLAAAAAAALGRIYSRYPDGELLTLLREGGPVAADASDEEEDWLALSIRAADAKGRFRALVMRGLALKYADSEETLPEPLAGAVYEALTDANDDLRLQALSLLPRCASSQATERLAVFLYTETRPALLVKALRVMGELRPPDYGEAVMRHVTHDDPRVQIEALAALDALGYANAMFPPVEGARSVATFVSHPSTPVRMRAIELLAATRNPAALEYLLAALFDRVGRNRAAAAQALGDLGFSGAVGGLTPLLRDGRPEVRAAAAVALSKLGIMGVAPGVIDNLGGESSPFRLAAATALGEIGDARAVPALLSALADDNIEVACAAADSLGRLRRREAGAGLYSALSAGRDPVLTDALRAALADIYHDDPGYSPSTWASWARRNGVQ